MDPIVSREWLAANREAVSVVDVRDPWEYEGIGHLPGAVNVPFDSFRSAETGEAGMLPGAGQFANLLGEAGIGPDDRIVAYDDTHGVFAARFVVTALVYGHEEVRLLDGDYSAWTREHPTSRESPGVEAVDHPPGSLVEGILVDADAVRAALSGEAVLVDTREPWEFEEGHLPGAVNLDWKALVDDETRSLGPDDDLRATLEAHGITPDRRVILYCNTARRISHTYLVLRHLEYPDVAFYEGSLTEWEAISGDLETGT